MSKLITPSILDSYDWYITCPSSFKENALKQIDDQLNRRWSDLSPAIRRGIDFEKKVCSNLWQDSKEEFMRSFEGHTPSISKFWDKCRASVQQAKTSKTVEVDGVSYYLYGKRDIAFQDKTIDIKTTKAYKGPDYYLVRNQHPLYIACTGIQAFEYLIAEFDDEKGVCTNVFTVDASMTVEDAEARVISKIKEFINFLSSDDELLAAYNKTFCKD